MPIQYYIPNAPALVCALACLYLLRIWRKNDKTSFPLPPGPRGLPLVGNHFDISETGMWEASRKWGERYGPLVHIRSLGTSYVFLNSYQSSVDLFDKRSSNYSSRPRVPMMDLQGWDWFITMLPYGDELNSARRMQHRFFQPTAMSDYYEMQTNTAHRMLERLLDSPGNYVRLLRQSVGESILSVSYGYRPLPSSDPYIVLIEKCVESFSNSLGFSLVNAFAPLQHLPAWALGAGFQETIHEGRKLSRWMVREPHEMAKKIILDGMATPSMTSKLMDAGLADDGTVKDEALIAKVTGATYAAGADTSVAALHTFLLAMLLYPEAQQRAQAELDKAIGQDVLPKFEDRDKLPYIEALVKEVLRWQPVVPLGIPHVVDEDDEYNGYLIPAGATIYSNNWAILRDPEEYPEPDKFIPERWLPSKGEKLPFDVHKAVFGVGRRICPGRHFATNTVFITIASILSAFNINKPLDVNGVPVTPRCVYPALAIRHPEPFEYVLTPRSDKMASVIRQATAAAA